jgi:hypothetical protein
MKLITGKSQNALFIYSRDNSGRFWVYDGIQYHHFFMDPQRFWYVRSQAYLPAFCVGSCAAFDAKERQSMEAEVAPYHITLPFFSTQEDCSKFAQLAQHEQVIFDQTFPAGFFYANNNLQK